MPAATPEHVMQEIRELYRSGCTIAQIVEMKSLGHSTVRKAISQESGLARKTSSKAFRYVDEILERYQAGESVHEIGLALSLAHTTIKKCIIDNGFEFEMRHAGRTAKCDNVDKLKSMLADPDVGFEDIEKKFQVSKPTINRWIEVHNITDVKRKLPSPKLDSDVYERLMDKDWLLSNYQDGGTVHVGNILGIADGTVARYMDYHGLDREIHFSCSSSKAEQEIADLISPYLDINLGDRKAIAPLELDIFVPDRQIGIEYNGLYWHKESRKGKRYHYKKYLAAQEAGIQLIQIWEDEWETRQDAVKSMIFNKLGLASGKVGARECTIISLSRVQAFDFLNEFHIQGSGPMSVAFGLEYDSQLVAAISFKRTGSSVAPWELTRYATSVSVPGGFTRLVKAFRSEYSGSIKTFADLCISDGGLYERNGWKLDGLVRPDFRYIVGKERQHKFGFRKEDFKSKPELLFEEGLTETELAELNGLDRIWDAGKLRYILD